MEASGGRTIAWSAVVLALALVVPGTTAIPTDTDASTGDPSCDELRAGNWQPARGVADAEGDVRVYAIQYKHEPRHVRSYEAFEAKMDCLVREFVLPTADGPDPGVEADQPTIVLLDEDTGLATLGIGTRGEPARQIWQHGPKDPDSLTGAITAFGSLAATYAPSLAYYTAKAPETAPQRLVLASATDMFARGFMATMSDLAERYGVYVVASNNQAEFRATQDPMAVAALMDPDLADRYATGELETVYEAVDRDTPPESQGEGRAGIDVYNMAWMWAPTSGVTAYAQELYGPIQGGPLSPDDPRANVVHRTKKTPVTQLERDVLAITDDHDMRATNTGPFTLLSEDDPDQDVRIGYGISLPSFQWGEVDCTDDDPDCTDGTRAPHLHEAPADGADPCSSPTWWMRCLDHRGTNLFLQPEANPGPWASYHDAGWDPPAFQALSWMDSAWRSIVDDTVNFRYAATAHLVGNLVDVTFDGQSVILERCLDTGDGTTTCQGNPSTTFVGAKDFISCQEDEERCDDPLLGPYAGEHRNAIVQADWVLDDDPALDPRENRARLVERSDAMEAGSGSPHEDAYLETAVWADLDFDPVS